MSIKCSNQIKDEENPNLRRCKVTGYLCQPTQVTGHSFDCIFEEKYMKSKRVKKVAEIARMLKPGMKVYYTAQQKSEGWCTGTQIITVTRVIKAIDRRGNLTVEPLSGQWTEHYPLSKLYNFLHVDSEALKEAYQRAADKMEQEEKIKKEGGETSEEVWIK